MPPRHVILAVTIACCVAIDCQGASQHAVSSPDGRISIAIEVDATVDYTLSLNGRTVSGPNRLDLEFANQSVLGPDPAVTKADVIEHDAWVPTVVARRSSRLRDHYRQLTLHFTSETAVEFRLYNDGTAYRFVTTASGSVDVTHETIELRFPSNATTFFPEEGRLVTHSERFYREETVAEIALGEMCLLPVLVAPTPGTQLLFTEADLHDYPSLFLTVSEESTWQARLPPVVLATLPDHKGPDRYERIVREANYVARTAGSRSFPWRVFVVGNGPRVLLENELVFLLSRSLAIDDPTWIKPGQAAWDWYNANNLFGVEFEAGLNTATYRYYIDFAAQYGIPYVILDEGWSTSTLEVDQPTPDIDLAELVAYGRERDVGLILWTLWKPIAEDGERVFSLYESWGIKGVKIDFIQRSDQAVVNFLERTAALAAKHRLLLDFHSVFKPSGLRRAYPNVLTYEGLKGAENNKWGQNITPRHNVTLPFIRMAAGPMDYTPGAMRNAQPVNHTVSFERPMSIGTRAHEVAKYIVFESQLQMLCDSPSLYLRDPATTGYITRIPVEWDETRFLAGTPGEFIAVARRSGDTWYVGTMTNENTRALTLDTSFLPEGSFEAETFADGVNAARYAEDFRIGRQPVTSTDSLSLRLAPNGGWSAIITPVKTRSGIVEGVSRTKGRIKKSSVPQYPVD